MTNEAWRTTGRMVARQVRADAAHWNEAERTLDAMIDTALTRGTPRPDDESSDAFYKGVCDILDPK